MPPICRSCTNYLSQGLLGKLRLVKLPTKHVTRWEKFLQNLVDDGGVPKVLDRFFSDCEVAYCFFYPTSQELVRRP